MNRRKFLNRTKLLGLFPLMPYAGVCSSFSPQTSVQDLINAAGNAANERDRYDLLVRIASFPEFEEEVNILVEVADRWVNGLEKFWNTDDDLTSSIEEEKGYLGGFFAVRCFPQGVFDFLQSGSIDISTILPGDFELPEENYPKQIPESSELYPIWAMYKGRMVVWSAVELGLGLYYFSEANELLSLAYARFPDNPTLAIYNGNPELWPDELLESGKAPKWATNMRAVLVKLMDIIDFWLNERQAPDGQIGGGWGDDVEVWRRWIPVLLGFDVPHVNEGMRKLTDGLWNLERMEGGYTSIMSDVEHSAEDSSDTLSMMILMQESGNWDEKVERIKNLLTDSWTGINSQGHRQFKSTYFTSDVVSSDADLGFQVNYHMRVLQPLLLNWHRVEGPDQTTVIELLDGIVEATLSDANGKPAGIPPAALEWPSGAHGGSFDWWTPDAKTGASGTFHFPRYTESLLSVVAQAYVVTDEPRYKQFLEQLIQLRKDQLDGVYPNTSTEGTLGWAAKKIGGKLTEAMDKLAAVGKTLAVDIPSQHSDYYRWMTTDDFSEMDSYLAEQREAYAYNRSMFMEEVRFTDRIDKFNDAYLNEHLGLDLAKPNMSTLYSLLTGDPGSPFFFPLNQIKWKADSRNTAMRVNNKTDFLAIDVHNFKNVSQSVRMELIARDEAFIEWGNGSIQPIGKYSNLHISPDTTISYKVLFNLPTGAEPTDYEVSLYPNPFIEELNYLMSWTSELKMKGTVEMVDINGKQIFNDVIHIEKGENTLIGNWKITGSQAVLQGVYVFRVLAGDDVLVTRKVVKH